MPDAGVPERVAVRSPLSTDATPEGNEPVSLSDDVGVRTALTVKAPAFPILKFVLAPEVKG